MGICVIRAVGRLSVRADASAIEPRLDITALPDFSTDGRAASNQLSAGIEDVELGGAPEENAVTQYATAREHVSFYRSVVTCEPRAVNDRIVSFYCALESRDDTLR
jgi:hypothetical protein